MRLTREKILEALLLSLNESKYLNHFPCAMMHDFSTLGYTAVTKQNSKIRTLLEVQAMALEDLLGHYVTPRVRKPTKRELARAEIQRLNNLEADKSRFAALEQSWKDDEPRAEKEMLENAEKAAKNIFAKNQELKKTRG